MARLDETATYPYTGNSLNAFGCTPVYTCETRTVWAYPFPYKKVMLYRVTDGNLTQGWHESLEDAKRCADDPMLDKSRNRLRETAWVNSPNSPPKGLRYGKSETIRRPCFMVAFQRAKALPKPSYVVRLLNVLTNETEYETILQERYDEFAKTLKKRMVVIKLYPIDPEPLRLAVACVSYEGEKPYYDVRPFRAKRYIGGMTHHKTKKKALEEVAKVNNVTTSEVTIYPDLATMWKNEEHSQVRGCNYNKRLDKSDPTGKRLREYRAKNT